jgi:hypothetical protein
MSSVAELDNGVSLDFADVEGPIRPQHHAFLISEADFDAVFGRIKGRSAPHSVRSLVQVCRAGVPAFVLRGFIGARASGCDLHQRCSGRQVLDLDGGRRQSL